MKFCKKCERELSAESFQRNGARLKSICRECVRANYRALHATREAAGQCLYCESPRIAGSDKCEFHVAERCRWRASAKTRIKEMLSSTRARARERGLVFGLDEEWIKSRLNGVCELTGLPFDLESGKKIGRFNPYAPSIDRIIPGGNYTVENCRMIVMGLNVGINYWGEEIYRHIAKAYLKQRANKRKKRPIFESYNLLLEDPQELRARKH